MTDRIRPRCDSSACIEVVMYAGWVQLWAAGCILPLSATREEWDVFVAAVKAGDFDQVTQPRHCGVEPT